MKPLVTAILTLLLASTARAQDIIKVEDIEKIKAAKGKQVTVRGTVSRASKSKSGINFINFPGEKFSAIMFSRDAKNFPDGEPADLYKEGKAVDITGTVEFYKEKPQIVLTQPTQIRLAPGQEEPPKKDESPEKKREEPKPAKEEPEKKVEPEPEPEPEKKDGPQPKKKPDPRKYFTD